MRRAWLAVASIALMLPVAPSASAGPIYRLRWNIPVPQVETGPVEITTKQELLRLPLAPPALFETPADVVDTEGRTLVPGGMQLVGMVSDAAIACTIHKLAKKGADAALFLGSLKRICLVDEDRDGQYDGYFVRATNAPAYFLLRGRLGAWQPIRKARLLSIAPERIIDPPRVALFASASPGKWVELWANAGNDRDPFPLRGGKRFNAAQLPADFPLYGGHVILAANKTGTFTATLKGPFEAELLDFWD